MERTCHLCTKDIGNGYIGSEDWSFIIVDCWLEGESV